MMNRLSVLALLILYEILTPGTATAQTDTLQLTLPAATTMLLRQNIPLLAQRYNIDSAKAAVITARLYDNPEVSFENVLYNHTTAKWFDFGYEGQNTLQVQQLIKLAGKRNKEIQLAHSGVKLSEYQFYDLLRTLRFELADNFYDLYYKQQSLQTYSGQIAFLKQVVRAFEQQQQLGHIAPKEIIRLKSLLYDLQHDELQLRQDVQQTQSDLALLIRVPPTVTIVPAVEAGLQLPLASAYSYQLLLDTAMQNRYDLKAANENVNYNEINLRLQKALAIPDIQVGLSYDKQGNFERNYNGLGVSMPLPFFNRNQGNIRMARATLEGSRLELQGRQDQLAHEVMNSFREAVQTEQMAGDIDPAFEQDYSRMMGEIEKNYRQHNIGLLEFIDLYDAYRSNVLKMNALRYSRLSALEKINYTTGAQIFHP
ncbi:outer membrane protein, cobalt-zinc-cadmium efflux system [Chitinophaga jiangningensis]|uniref:Outer membrane protein, cobalt-zinc-cadmium efflux system n=1 Tax=Chitinophaga jiangningensis TaxID=1419482 RepID=A0A1M7KEM1_9BACT|nr:TolC family protein [Chitinophaga jiangningensis]SHM63707.1 outer membrane protein, cobalt-zinc-cadmium efflux system [Chitinophaga jiangningensis]